MTISLQVPAPPVPVFSVTPDKLVIEPGAVQQITINGFSKDPGDVQQQLLCQALIGKNTNKDTVFEVDLRAQFVHPYLSFSQKSLNFTFLKVKCRSSHLIRTFVHE